ncbi:ABC transporter ATP-binding protein [Halorubellus sp. JP-L1]|uniref:ABC transporter ATP-binding protein n=1 Tax=Halorubellus sp. JP-L1 TaxID=2715753 RepID=UPI001409F2A1|nr:ABC transporter ATP-binding protein [Halorubellus sp. JP-L1]NHN42799.1 ABC transporter ATP-binding protein [Halorubellus sp. JP-L1]
MSVLNVEDVTTGYTDVPVIKDVSLEIEDNEIVGVIGPNGAGKSTVLKVIMGYLSPWEGSITFKGSSIAGERPSNLIKQGIGYVPQRDNVFPDMTVDENIQMGGFTVDDDELEDRKAELYELFPRLEERKDQDVVTMSGGEQKMVAIARAVVTEPELILFDEPSAGLMPKYVQDVFEKLREIQERRSTSFVTIEQNVNVILRNSDRTYVLREGSVYMERESSELLENEDLREAYLGGR